MGLLDFSTIMAYCLLITYVHSFNQRGILFQYNSNRNTKLHMDLNGDYTAVMIVPTGIGASIGGYGGDALPACRLLAAVCDRLITHPNVMNGAMLYAEIPNVLYVEGYALDEFAADRLGLLPVTKKGHKIGLLVDAAIEEDLRIRHLQVADAFRATLGIDVSACVITSQPVGVEIALSASGASWGTLNNIQTLKEAAGVLLQQGCTAIAVVVRFPEDESEEEKGAFEKYRKGGGVDCIAGITMPHKKSSSLVYAVDALYIGAEAIISHVITKQYLVPCAHAPAFAPFDAGNIYIKVPFGLQRRSDTSSVDVDVSPKSCSEELGYTFLPCVLKYLHRAPSLVPVESDAHIPRNLIRAEDVDAVVAPVDALGGPAVLSFLDRGALIIAVEENTTVMDVSEQHLVSSSAKGRIVRVRSYAEAAGILVAHREGILFDSLTSSVNTIPITHL